MSFEDALEIVYGRYADDDHCTPLGLIPPYDTDPDEEDA